MMCCRKCPFNPVSGSAEQRCHRPLCSSQRHDCDTGFCAANIGSRCFQDYYVIERLYQQDTLAEELVQHSLKTALTGRDRALLLSLFQAASERIRLQLWHWLEIYEPRSLWLLNPIFAAVGSDSARHDDRCWQSASSIHWRHHGQPIQWQSLSPCFDDRNGRKLI